MSTEPTTPELGESAPPVVYATFTPPPVRGEWTEDLFKRPEPLARPEDPKLPEGK